MKASYVLIFKITKGNLSEVHIVVCKTQIEVSKDQHCMTLYVVSFNYIFRNAMGISFILYIPDMLMNKNK